MSAKIVEYIRQLLIKTILPLKKKKDRFLSQFRFSIAFRTSLNYSKLLVIYGVLFFATVILISIGVEQNRFDKMGKNIILNLINDPEILQRMPGHLSLNPYYYNGVTVRIMLEDKVVFDDISLDITADKAIWGRYSYHYKGSNDFIIKDEKSFVLDNKKCEVYFQYNLTKSLVDIKTILLWSMVAYIGLIFLVMKSGQKGILKLFRPIDEMSGTANRLNINNLHNERLNVEGTKNELKDLAEIINHMLDRIELSYESQKQFVSDASHELRTPIAVIQGYANLLDRWGSKDEEVLEESIDAIRNEAKSMQDLVEKLLFLSRHDKKTLKLIKTKFNIKPVVDDMVKETRLVVENREIECPILEDVIVYGDKQAIKQALRIFIDNAVKYTKEGDGITIRCENKNGDCVLSVEDTGLGMTKKDLDHIFERFYRSDHVRNEKISGHGLGLSIAKLIVLKHTGRIKVRSQYKKGSCFTITIPKNNR